MGVDVISRYAKVVLMVLLAERRMRGCLNNSARAQTGSVIINEAMIEKWVHTRYPVCLKSSFRSLHISLYATWNGYYIQQTRNIGDGAGLKTLAQTSTSDSVRAREG